ncbi:two-component sensor histidine kinase [[Clostridium] sordellii]|nr:two-component sensor histidine kinase [[Clostridium] sordellii] [Paeniclostridium sordellii]
MLTLIIKGEVSKINLKELIFMAIPEGIVIFSGLSIIIEKNIRKRDIFYMGVIYAIICFFIRNITPIGLNSIISNIVVAAMIYIYSKSSILRCCIATIITMTMLLFLEMTSILFINLMGVNLDFILKNQVLKILVYYIPICVMFIIIRLFRYKKFLKEIDNNSKLYRSKQVERLVFYISSFIIIIIGIVVLLIYKNRNLKFDAEQFLILFLTCSFILILIALMLILINYNKKRILNDMEINLIQNNLKQMEDTVDVLRLQRHDYMNHLQVILMQVTSGKNEDAKNYILGLSTDDTSGFNYFSTGNSCIDAVLNTKNRRALKYDIQLTSCIDSLLEEVELSDSELSAILLNIIDNAIDELKKSKDDYKYIHVDVYKEEDYHNISIKNNGRKIEDLNKIFELGYSSKGKNRGYGLYSIKRILESYNCTIEVYSDDIETEFNIKVPCHIKKV